MKNCVIVANVSHSKSQFKSTYIVFYLFIYSILKSRKSEFHLDVWSSCVDHIVDTVHDSWVPK